MPINNQFDLNRLKLYKEECISSFNTIDASRKKKLEEVAVYIQNKAKNNDKVNLIFICTHNSRRSHISQIWAQAAAYHFEIHNVECFSAGTEATAFNPRAVAAMQRAGFSITQQDNSNNPLYKVTSDSQHNALNVFSKVIEDKKNPQNNFAAIMTCSSANEACPIIHGAEIRYPIMYEDPKVADDTPQETEKYDERVKQIGTEMLYLFSKIEI